MSRPLRIEYANAWYHVMNRGRRRESVFTYEKDYNVFITLLKETVEMWNLRIAAYCLIPNHYHILIQTPDANLSRCMRHIDGVYTQRFNRVHGTDGQLFRGRYKSILVDEQGYLLELLRYIHRNPLKAGLSKTFEGYAWSSHKGYISKAKKWSWLHKQYVLSKFSRTKNEQLIKYRAFVSKESGHELEEIIEGKKWTSILGSKTFKKLIKDRFFKEQNDVEIPESKKLAPDIDTIIKTDCDFYGIEKTELMVTRSRLSNEPRDVAIYLNRRLRKDTLNRITENFQMNTYKTVASVLSKMNKLVSGDRKFRKKIERISTLIKN